MYETLLFEVVDRVAVITVNRPQKLNALNARTVAELTDAFTRVRNDPAIGAAVLTGAGERAFIAGADIAELSGCDAASGAELARRGQALTLLMERCGKPVVAAINGFALGGGCELAMACTFRVAVRTAKLGQPEINLGLIPGYGGSQRLARLIGSGRALELILTGAMITAEEALALGLVNRVVEPGQARAEAESWARELVTTKPPLAIKAAIEAVQEGLSRPLAEGLALEARLFGALCATEDMKEGTAAFLQKRPPRFRGR
ncbi:MAG TPA: enoyl-CoA hydratase-related protein [Thermodesulfobacteriota bacterium]|nr:enoyl-CoA hydratase-related protein [Thermodesulfobacteriota bacterium]